MLLDWEGWVNPTTRNHWESGPKFRLVERRCSRVSDGETEAQKQVTGPSPHREQSLTPELPVSTPCPCPSALPMATLGC